MSDTEFETYTVEAPVMLDSICWRRYRRPTPGLVEKTFDLNPGLAALGPFLPTGTKVKLPIDRPAARQQRPVVRLWE